MVKLICKICGGDFSVKPYRIGKAKTCSDKCRAIYVGQKNKGKHIKGHPAWNKNLKGIRLSPKSEFKKGQEPWNKGMKGIVLSDKNWFEKGIIPHNKRPVGSKSIRLDSHGTLRNWIKIAEPNIWIPYYRYIWVKAGFDIPKGMVLHHKNLRSDDDRLENLELVYKQDHPRIHSRWRTNNGPQQIIPGY